MSGPHDTRLAKVAYRAHNRALGAAAELPEWEDLPPRVQTAWEVSAETVWRDATRTLLPQRPRNPCEWCRGTGRAAGRVTP
jgi:hypothetical protein